jgi:putative membrane protein
MENEDPATPKDTSVQRAGHVGRGFLMGTADVIPGVSGGTVALVLGIYPRLVNAIRNIDLDLARAALGAVAGGSEGRHRFRRRLAEADLLFLILLGLGILTALVTLAGVLTYLLETQPVVMLALFFGLILASAWIPWRMIHWDPGTVGHVATIIAWGVFGFALAWWIAGIHVLLAPQGSWFVVVAGAIAICAMILPGISGAFLLLIMGMYDRMLEALHERDLAVIGLFIAGAAVGILSFSRLLWWLLATHRNRTMAALTGLMLGSLRRLWPFKDAYDAEFATGRNVLPGPWSADIAAALMAFLLGAAVVVLIEAVAAWHRHRTASAVTPEDPA